MKAPCIAIDVSKSKSHIQGFNALDKPFKKVEIIDHDLKGFEKLLLLVDSLKNECGINPIIAFEATGIYHKPLQNFLNHNNLNYCIISPLESAKIRKSKIRTTKTDKRDCKNIANAYFTRDFPIYREMDDIYYDLKILSRHYNFLMNELRKLKVEYHRLLDLVFPAYDTLYSDIYRGVPFLIVKKYKHPDEIKNKKVDTIAKFIEKETCHNLNWSTHEAKKIISYASNCVSGVNKNSMDVVILNEVLVYLMNQIELVDECLDRLTSVASRLPHYRIVKSVPGIGDKLAARLCAEIGDITRFHSGSSLVSFAGLDPMVYQSGKSDGLHLSITKKGNKTLRSLIYLAASACLRTQKENSINGFYRKKRQQANSLSHKAALVACSNKMLRIIYSLCKNGIFFE